MTFYQFLDAHFEAIAWIAITAIIALCGTIASISEDIWGKKK